MSDLLTVALVALATHRITRLVVADRITQAPRQRIQAWFETRWEKHYFPVEDSDEWRSHGAYLLSCMWCTGVYVAAAVTIVTGLTVGVPYPVLTYLAAASVTGWIGTRV